MARSLNRVQLIGNLTRDPELRYTPNGTAVCSFGIATNRSWTTDTGERKEEVEFHRIVAWNKLAELCSQFLIKGRKVYVEGRLATRSWTGQDGQQRNATEIVIDEMILLDSRRPTEEPSAGHPQGREESAEANTSNAEDVRPTKQSKSPPVKKSEVADENINEKKKQEEKVSDSDDDNVTPDDIPF